MSAPCFLTIARDEFDKQDHEGSTTVESQLLPDILQAIIRRMATAATDTPIEHIRSELWQPVAEAAARGSVIVENNIQSLFSKTVRPAQQVLPLHSRCCDLSGDATERPGRFRHIVVYFYLTSVARPVAGAGVCAALVLRV